jgi:hypothetical protein
MSENQQPLEEDDNGLGETRRTADQPVPATQARRAGEEPVAGKVSPAEKSEPSGVPAEEQRHNADPNAPGTTVVPPGETERPESETGGVPATSIDSAPPLGSDEARLRAQISQTPAPEDAGEGSSRQENEPNESDAAGR